MSALTRAVMTGAVIGGVLTLTVVPAAATANPASSCVGTITSALAPAGAFDVQEFKAVAQGEGAENFGLFVAFGARLHEGTLENCLP